MRETEVLVIGAGQAGLSAAYHLRRNGIEAIVLDAGAGPGGAWRHRWDTLTMGGVNVSASCREPLCHKQIRPPG